MKQTGMIPNAQWGSVYVEQVELPEQRFVCASCGQVATVLVQVQGTVYCQNDNPLKTQ